MTRKEREELNELSKRVFGSSSKWKKLVEKGLPELYTRNREVMIPSVTGVEKKVFTDKKYMTKRYTVEEVRKLMLDEVAKYNAVSTVSSTPYVGPPIPAGTSVTLSDGSTATVTASE